MKINLIKLVISIVICQLAGVVGSIFTYTAISEWYPTLIKPWWTPPNWLFAPVWITLFTLMGISLYIVWDKGLEKKEVKTAVSIFSVQLILNILWSVIFFGLKSPLFGFIEIVILWIAILFTMIKFYRISRASSYILIPYIVWVTIAAFLNFSILILNV